MKIAKKESRSAVGESQNALTTFDSVLRRWRQKVCYGMSMILPNLFVGSLRDANNIPSLQENEISDVLSIHGLSGRPAKFGNLNVLHLSLADRPEVEISDYFRQAILFIHRARMQKRSVLVHCLAGVSRSVCIVAAYLMVIGEMSYADSLAFITRKRPCANPNFGFRMQLAKYANEMARTEWMYLFSEFDETELLKQRSVDFEFLSHYTFTSRHFLMASKGDLDSENSLLHTDEILYIDQ